MGQLIEDRAVYVSKSGAVSTSPLGAFRVRLIRVWKTVDQMYSKLKAFKEDRTKGQTRSSFSDRFKFRIKHQNRAKSLEMIDKWNVRLERFISRLDHEPSTQKTFGAQSTTPSSQIRQRAEHLYKALADQWTCRCPNDRQVKIRLNARTEKTEPTATGDCSFDLLLSKQLRGTQSSSLSKWLEAKAILRGKR